jgi:DeoR/GlpR family transcriptional regulator of sugar metabolism
LGRPRDQARAVRMRILERLARAGSISTGDVARLSGLDARSARRLLSSLADLIHGIVRCRGGAIYRGSPYQGTYFGAALRRRAAHKRSIARAVARRLAETAPRNSVFLGPGSSAYYVAEALARADGVSGLVVMTNNLAAIGALCAQTPALASLTVSGGYVFAPTASIEGHAAAESIQRFRADLVVLSLCAISPSDGSLYYRFAEQETATRAILDCASQEVVIACDSSKFSDSGPFAFSSLQAILAAGVRRVTVVTDSELHPQDALDFETNMKAVCGDAFDLAIAALGPSEMRVASKLPRDRLPKAA